MKWQLLPASRFEDYRQSWQTLNDQTLRSALMHPDLWGPALEYFATGQERLAIAGDHEPQAMTLLRQTRQWTWETFQPSQCPLGPWLAAPQYPPQTLLSGLLRALPGYPIVIGLTQQDPDFYPRSDAPHSPIHTLDYIQTARVPLSGTFEDYWEKRGKNLRANMKKQRNQLAKAGKTLRMVCHRHSTDMDQAIRDFGQLEMSGWKNDQGTAVHADNPQGKFYTRIMKNFSLRDKARVYALYYDDDLVAMDLCILDDQALIILKTAYHETLREGTSPAFLLHQDMFTTLFTEKPANNIEFYGRVLEWHTRWTDDVRTLYHLNGYRWPLAKKILLRH